MVSPADNEAIRLLERSRAGENDAADDLFELLYDELRQIAHRCVGNGNGPVPLQPTAVVHEVYLKLVGGRHLEWNDRTHFRAIAARAMQQVVADHVRAADRLKRGGGWDRVTLDGIQGSAPLTASEVSAALERLAELDERAARVVVLRYFGGLTDQAIAEQLGVTDRTVRNDWQMARAWLLSELTRDGSSQ